MAKECIQSIALARLLMIRREFWDGHKLRIKIIDKKDYDFMNQLKYIEDWQYFLYTIHIWIFNFDLKGYDLIFYEPEFDWEFYSLVEWKNYEHCRKQNSSYKLDYGFTK